MMADQQKQLAFDSPELQSTGYQFSQTNGRLPSPPALFGEDDYVYHHSIQNKRRRSDSVLQERISKKQRKSSNPARFRERPTVMASLSPPLSPPFSSALKNETLFDNLDCFGYASGEDSSDDETDYFNER
jgi:hypothetical protein